MSEERTQAYQAFIQNAWRMAVNHQDGETIPQDDFVIFSTPEKYVHAINAQRVKHIYDRHGNIAAEKLQGQIAITESDFWNIPHIIKSPTFIIENVKRYGVNGILYGKQNADGQTYVYKVIEPTRGGGQPSSDGGMIPPAQ